MLRYCANLKAIRYESKSLNRIVADKSHRVIVALYVEECVVLSTEVSLIIQQLQRWWIGKVAGYRSKVGRTVVQ